MSQSKLYEQGATKHRFRYAIQTLLRDRLCGEGAFNVCFEMQDADTVSAQLFERGERDRRLRVALEKSPLVNPAVWLFPRPAIAEVYCRLWASENQTESTE